MNMNAVDIDVFKRKSTVAVLRPSGEVVVKPFDVPHNSSGFHSLIDLIRSINGKPASSWNAPDTTTNR